MTGDAIVCDCGRLHDAAEPCPTCGAGEELFDHVCGYCEGPDVCCGDPDDCEHFVCPWSDDDPDPEPGSWEWEWEHGCLDCGVCDDCIERTRAHFEEMSDAEVRVLGEGKP